jgi:hypothetical protein
MHLAPNVIFLSRLSPFLLDPASVRHLTPEEKTKGVTPCGGDPSSHLAQELRSGTPEDLEVIVAQLDRLQEAFVAEVAEALEDVVAVGSLVEVARLEDVVQPEEPVGATSGGEDRLEDTGLDGLDRLLLGGSLLTALGLLGEGQSTVLQLEEPTRAELEDLHRSEVLEGGAESGEDRGGEGLSHVELQPCWFVTSGIFSPW